MTDHYFSERPSSGHLDLRFMERLAGRDLTFSSDAGVFSKSKVDLGSKLLISVLRLSGSESVLDWGCGYGPIGIAAACLLHGGSVIMVDVNSRAVELAKANLKANGITNAEVRHGDGFDVVPETELDVILCNPPIRAGKQVIYAMVDEAPLHLRPSGRLIMVAKTSQGAKSLIKKMEDVFGNAVELEKGSGFRVMESVKAR